MLQTLPKEYIKAWKEKSFISLKVCKRRQPDDKGNTHYIEVDTWKPDPNYKKTPSENNNAQIGNQSFDNFTPPQDGDPDVPF